MKNLTGKYLTVKYLTSRLNRIMNYKDLVSELMMYLVRVRLMLFI